MLWQNNGGNRSRSKQLFAEIRQPGKTGENMNECYKEKDGSLTISEWYRGGGMMYRRDCMPHKTGESTAMCIIKLGENPEDYGHKDPRKDCPTCKGTGIAPDNAKQMC